jgi:hypothetical protein
VATGGAAGERLNFLAKSLTQFLGYSTPRAGELNTLTSPNSFHAMAREMGPNSDDQPSSWTAGSPKGSVRNTHAVATGKELSIG